MSNTEKLRRRNRQLRAGLSAAQLEQAAAALAQRIFELDEFQRAERLAAYFAVNGEIGLGPVIDAALDAGKQVFLPNLDQQALRFAPYFHDQKMRMNRYRLPEPDVADSELLAPDRLDLVLVPLVVFDVACNRIGMGGGYYDRSFAFRKQSENRLPRLIGVAHELQKADSLQPEAWDVQLDAVVTDAAVYARPPSPDC